MVKLLYPELSYKIVGCLYDIYNELGSGYQEKYYQRALAGRFKKEKVGFVEQIPADLISDGKSIGRYLLDFLVEKKIIIELKVGFRLYPRDFKQIRAYLKRHGLELGILVLFSKKGVEYHRILNMVNKLE